MKKSKRLTASFLAVLMLMAVMIVPAAMATPITTIVRTPGLNIASYGPLGFRATQASLEVWGTFPRSVTAQVYVERSNGSSIWSVGTGRNNQAISGHINVTGMARVWHSGWITS